MEVPRAAAIWVFRCVLPGRAVKLAKFSKIKCTNGLQVGNLKFLSQAGRTVLLQTVAAALPTYFMAVYSLPEEVLRSLDVRFKNFWWGFDESQKRHFHPKDWTDICTPKTRGGIGLRTMADMNRALLAKLGWQMITSRNLLWVQALRLREACCRSGTLWLPVFVGELKVEHTLTYGVILGCPLCLIFSPC